MWVQKLYSKKASSRIKDNARRLPISHRSIGVSPIERPVVDTRGAVRIHARVQVDARASRRKLSAWERAIDQREARRARVLEVLKSLLRYEERRIDCGVVAAHLHAIKLPWHATRIQHLLDVVTNPQHGLAVDAAHVEVVLQFCMYFKLVSHGLYCCCLVDVGGAVEIHNCSRLRNI